MTRPLIFALLLCLCSVPPLAAQTRMLRHPSYHAGKVAFDYLGDIWTADESGANPRRLTVHPAQDSFPRFSPDGKWIAFTSFRTGAFKVFVIPSQGGPARQLTFHSDADWVVGWAPDSAKVLFYTTRHRPGGTRRYLYQVGLDGSMETPVPVGTGDSGTFAPDGRRFAFNQLAPNWWRKHYRGSFAAEIWTTDLTTHAFARISDADFHGNCLWPQWAADGFVYFVADRLPNEKSVVPGSPQVMKSAYNIWKVPEKGGPMVQVTTHTGGNVFFPSISADRKTIVYENDLGLWKLDVASGKSSEIRVAIASDSKDNVVEWLTFDSAAERYALSPSGKRVAVENRGEIFTVAADQGDIRRVTASSSREMMPAWSPDGQWLAFISDKSGQPEIWISDERGGKQKKLTASDTEKAEFVWAPDSKSILYAASDGTLSRVDVETATSVAIASNAMGFADLQFSPDAAWIAYTAFGTDFLSHVRIRPAGPGQEHEITRDDIVMSDRPKWTPDGKRLVFRAHTGNSLERLQTTLYSVSLTKETQEPNYKGVDDEPPADAPVTDAAAGGGAPKRDARKIEVRIDFDGLSRRLRALTRGELVGQYAVSPAGRTYAFLSSGEIYTVDEDTARPTKVTPVGGPDASAPGGSTVSSLQFTRDGKTLFFKQGNGVFSMAIGQPVAPGASGPARRKLGFTVRMIVNHAEERQQIFGDVWRTLRYRFYDKQMSGLDWNAVRAMYEPALGSVDDPEALAELLKMMIGELNASHAMVGAGTPGQARAPRVRHPGFELEADPSGFYRVSRVLRKGPADKEFVKVKAGDFVIALNDQALKSGENYWQRYDLVPGRRFEFTVNSKPVAEGAWKITVDPTTDEAGLYYQDWVETRRARVDEASQGQVGYLHIRLMDAPHLEQFREEFYANRGKKAVVIDVRNNPGGNAEQELLELLGQRQYITLLPRHGVPLMRAQQAFAGPMVVLQNEASSSNGEMLPEGFRALGLGPIVGTPTPGYVILTSPYELMDGSTLSVPHGATYRLSGENMDNHGVVPDVVVEMTPEDYYKGRDPQLDKAIETALKQIGKPSPRPAR